MDSAIRSPTITGSSIVISRFPWPAKIAYLRVKTGNMHRKSDVNGLHVPQTGLVTLALMRILMDMALVLAIPTEYLYDADTQSVGYTYTYFSSSAEVLSVTSSSTYNVTFSLPVSQYFYQIKNVQAVTDVALLTGLVSLGGAVIADGSLFANLVSYLQRRWTDYSSGRGTFSSAANKQHLMPLI